jgi:soluble lytic murein transglycosylase
MLLIGKTALAHGMAMEQYAFPNIGVPLYSAIGPQLDRCVVYSIVHTESGFDQRDKSSAKAVGLMQVTPEAGRDTAKRFGVAYSWDRFTTPRWALPKSPPYSKSIVAPTSWRSPGTMRGVAESRNG